MGAGQPSRPVAPAHQGRRKGLCRAGPRGHREDPAAHGRCRSLDPMIRGARVSGFMVGGLARRLSGRSQLSDPCTSQLMDDALQPGTLANDGRPGSESHHRAPPPLLGRAPRADVRRRRPALPPLRRTPAPHRNDHRSARRAPDPPAHRSPLRAAPHLARAAAAPRGAVFRLTAEALRLSPRFSRLPAEGVGWASSHEPLHLRDPRSPGTLNRPHPHSPRAAAPPLPSPPANRRPP